MLNGGYTEIFALAQHGTALSVNHILGNSLDGGHTFQVDTLNLVTGILGGWIESYCEAQARMQALTTERETSF